MAKATVLICDRCPTQQPAVDTLTLRRSRGTSVALDLCARHAKELVQLFRIKPVSKPKAPWTKADYETIDAKILELADSRPFFTGADVRKYANIKPFIALVAIKRLIAAGKITATGQYAGRKLSKAS